MTWWIAGAAAGSLLFASLGAWVAIQKRRRTGEGLVLGLLFGPIGVIIEAVLPNEDRQAPSFNPDWAAYLPAVLVFSALAVIVVILILNGQ